MPLSINAFPVTLGTEVAPRPVSAAGFHIMETPWIVKPHAHEEETEFLFVQSGQGKLHLEGEILPLADRDMVIYLPGTWHYEDWQNSVSIPVVFYFKIPGHPFPPEDEELIRWTAQHPVVPTGDCFAQVSMLTQALIQECGTKAPGYLSTCDYLVDNALVLLRRLVSLRHPSKKTTQDLPLSHLVVQYIDQHYGEDITLAQLAECHHISAYHLSHVFKRDMEVSPIQYLNKVRMEHARMLLHSTNILITDVARQVGFENTPNFNQMFKKNVGLSPTQYRKRTFDELFEQKVKNKHVSNHDDEREGIVKPEPVPIVVEFGEEAARPRSI